MFVDEYDEVGDYDGRAKNSDNDVDYKVPK